MDSLLRSKPKKLHPGMSVLIVIYLTEKSHAMSFQFDNDNAIFKEAENTDNYSSMGITLSTY